MANTSSIRGRRTVARTPADCWIRLRSTAACIAAALLVTACARGAAEDGTPPYPRVSDVPSRPEGLPTEEALAQRRSRLEADRESAYGRETPASPADLEPDPLPELTETMQELPVERPSGGLVDGARPGVSVQVATVYFPADSPELDEPMIEALSQVAREQQSIGGGIRVIGYGGISNSRDLARRQMAAIGQTLLRMGVPPTRIESELAESAADEISDHGRAVIYLDY